MTGEMALKAYFLLIFINLPLLCISNPIRKSAVTSISHENPVRGNLDNNAPYNYSIYICQNFMWYQPCTQIPLYPENNGEQSFWMAPAPGGPGPFGTGNYTIGSWGASLAVTTYWADNHGNTSDLMSYPGTGNVDPYWGHSVWTYVAFWDDDKECEDLSCVFPK